MNPLLESVQHQTRRQFLTAARQFSIGAVAMHALQGGKSAAATAGANPFSSKPAGTRAKVKRVIYLQMSGGPPHLDIFDYKPELVKRNG